MKLKFIQPEELDKNLKATIHKTGKMGFTYEAAKKMELSTEKGATIAINEDDPLDLNLYVFIIQKMEGGAFKISKSGSYYYVNTKTLFDNLKIDYTKETIIYDIIPEKIENVPGFRFKRRAAKKVKDTSKKE